MPGPSPSSRRGASKAHVTPPVSLGVEGAGQAGSPLSPPPPAEGRAKLQSGELRGRGGGWSLSPRGIWHVSHPRGNAARLPEAPTVLSCSLPRPPGPRTHRDGPSQPGAASPPPCPGAAAGRWLPGALRVRLLAAERDSERNQAVGASQEPEMQGTGLPDPPGPAPPLPHPTGPRVLVVPDGAPFPTRKPLAGNLSRRGLALD